MHSLYFVHNSKRLSKKSTEPNVPSDSNIGVHSNLFADFYMCLGGYFCNCRAFEYKVLSGHENYNLDSNVKESSFEHDVSYRFFWACAT